MIGTSVVDVSLQGRSPLIDLRLEFSNDILLELFSTYTYDQWVLRLPDLTIAGPLASGCYEGDVGG